MALASLLEHFYLCVQHLKPLDWSGAGWGREEESPRSSAPKLALFWRGLLGQACPVEAGVLGGGGMPSIPHGPGHRTRQEAWCGGW